MSSLDSGRLYQQAMAMCKHYQTPILLIEFDPSKAFALQSVADLGADIRATNVTSKLIILLLNFPKLRCGYVLAYCAYLLRDILRSFCVRNVAQLRSLCCMKHDSLERVV
jgi:hypothetical protein